MIFALSILAVMIVFLLWAAKNKKLGNYPGGAGNALVQLHTFVRPSTQQVVEAKKQRKKENKQGDAPELLPWAHSQ